MATTTIKVPEELRDRLIKRARRNHTTIAETIADSLDLAEEAAFWNDVRATMGDAQAQAADTEKFAGTLRDGLDPDEDWSDVL